jgi:hypothetical protein
MINRKNSRFGAWFIVFIGLIACINPLWGQSKYLMNGNLVAQFPIHFTDGYMFATVPVIDTDIYGKAITLHRSFILDPAASNDGSFQPDDSQLVITGTRKFYFPVSPQRTIIADLVPTLAKGKYKFADTSFFGVLGYAFLKKYITIINFEDRTITLYSIGEGDPKWNPSLDTGAINVPYLDDAILAHCNCPFPTMWFDGKSQLLKDGRVHFSLADRQSVIFTQALDPKTQRFFEKKWQRDSLAGKKREPERIQVQSFELGEKDIAIRNPRRIVADLPPIFRNLNIFIMGTVAVDVLRMFDAVIIDPTKMRVLLVK